MRTVMTPPTLFAGLLAASLMAATAPAILAAAPETPRAAPAAPAASSQPAPAASTPPAPSASKQPAPAKPSGAPAAQAPTAAPAAPAAAGTPDAALARIVRPPWGSDPWPPKEEVAEIRRVLTAAAAKEPTVTKWTFGLAHVAKAESRYASGDAAATLRKQSYEGLQKVVAKEPTNADYQYWLGVSCFERIDDVGMLKQASLAREGRGAFETAIKIDPSNVRAHYALGVFYNQAPGIVGGSTAKAKEEAETLLKITGGRGQFPGQMLYATIAISAKDWQEMSRRLTAAESAPGEWSDPSAAMQTHIWNLLNSKKDPAAALPVITRYRAQAKPDDQTADFFEGEVQRQLGHCDKAVGFFERVLEKNASARNTRYFIAECYETLGRKADAKKNYDDFVTRFPDDDRADKARQASKRLG